MSLHVSLCNLHRYGNFAPTLDSWNFSSISASNKFRCIYENACTALMAPKKLKATIGANWLKHPHCFFVNTWLAGNMNTTIGFHDIITIEVFWSAVYNYLRPTERSHSPVGNFKREIPDIFPAATLALETKLPSSLLQTIREIPIFTWNEGIVNL